MSEPATISPAVPRMTSDEFIAWALGQPNDCRYELVGGQVVTMASEGSAHALIKARVWRALDEATNATDLPCIAYPNGMAVVVDDVTTYEPDALVRCGEPLPDDAVIILDPVIVVEVVPPSTRARDTGAKLEDYFRLPSLHHYLIVKTENRAVIHHRRLDEGSGTIATRIVRAGEIELTPPGLRVTVESFFP